MTDIEIVLVLWLLTLLASLMMGAAMLGALHGARHREALWRDEAYAARRAYTELRFTSHRRDPSTGRLMKKGL